MSPKGHPRKETLIDQLDGLPREWLTNGIHALESRPPQLGSKTLYHMVNRMAI
jgi:hypothetical protein